MVKILSAREAHSAVGSEAASKASKTSSDRVKDVKVKIPSGTYLMSSRKCLAMKEEAEEGVLLSKQSKDRTLPSMWK